MRGTVDKSHEIGIINYNNKRMAVINVNICKLDIAKYKCVTPDIITDEVIITDKQIEHIKERHLHDFEKYFDYAANAN